MILLEALFILVLQFTETQMSFKIEFKNRGIYENRREFDKGY